MRRVQVLKQSFHEHYGRVGHECFAHALSGPDRYIKGAQVLGVAIDAVVTALMSTLTPPCAIALHKRPIRVSFAVLRDMHRAYEHDPIMRSETRFDNGSRVTLHGLFRPSSGLLAAGAPLGLESAVPSAQNLQKTRIPPPRKLG